MKKINENTKVIFKNNEFTLSQIVEMLYKKRSCSVSKRKIINIVLKRLNEMNIDSISVLHFIDDDELNDFFDFIFWGKSYSCDTKVNKMIIYQSKKILRMKLSAIEKIQAQWEKLLSKNNFHSEKKSQINLAASLELW